MPGITYKDGATARDAVGVFYGDGASLRTLSEVWIGDGGTNRKVWPASLPNAQLHGGTIFAYADTPMSAGAALALNTTGQEVWADDLGSSYAWMLSGVASDFEAYCTVNSGTLTTGTAGAWLSLSVDRSWSITRSTLGTKTTTITVQIRRASDSVVVASQAYTMNATVSSS